MEQEQKDPNRKDRFLYEKLGELHVDDSEASGPLLIEDDEETTTQVKLRGGKRLNVHVHKEQG